MTPAPEAPKVDYLLRQLVDYLNGNDPNKTDYDRRGGRLLTRAKQLAADWEAPLSAASGSYGGHGKGDHADPTFTAALGTNDETTRYNADLTKALNDLVLAAGAVASTVQKITRTAKNTGRETRVTNCTNPACGSVITNIGNDRPRRGRCQRCARHLSRYDIDWPRRAPLDDNGQPLEDTEPTPEAVSTC